MESWFVSDNYGCLTVFKYEATLSLLKILMVLGVTKGDTVYEPLVDNRLWHWSREIEI